MVKIELCPGEILAGTQIAKIDDEPINRSIAASRRHKRKPFREVLMPARAVEAGIVVVANEHEDKIDGLRVPRWSGRDAYLPQAPQRLAFRSLLVVLLDQTRVKVGHEVGEVVGKRESGPVAGQGLREPHRVIFRGAAANTRA